MVKQPITKPSKITTLGAALFALLFGISYIISMLMSSPSFAAPTPALTTQTGPTAGNTTTELPLALQGKTISQVAAGGPHSLALTTDGSLYAWGYNG